MYHSKILDTKHDTSRLLQKEQ